MGAYSADKMVCGLGTLYPALYTGSPTETLSDVSEMQFGLLRLLPMAQESPDFDSPLEAAPTVLSGLKHHR